MKPPRAGRGIFPAAAKLVATGCIGISFGSRSVAFVASIPSAPQSYLNVNETGSLAHDATTTSVVLASSLTKEVSLMASRSVAFGAVPPVGVTVAIATGAVYTRVVRVCLVSHRYITPFTARYIQVPAGREAWFLLATAVSMQFAQLAMTSVLRTRQLSIVAPSSFLIIVWNVLFGLLCFGDGLPSLHTAVGCTLVVGSLAYGERNVRARVVVAAGELKK